tara:strand:+ start:185 stop:493 length:309 start_codon:yes stop_codon:yes gene_type:complete
MAVGDVVTLHSANNTLLTAQPAGSVTWLITCCTMDYTKRVPELTNGSEASQCQYQAEYEPDDVATGSFNNVKIFVDNTNYLQIQALSGAAKSSAITGIVYSE